MTSQAATTDSKTTIYHDSYRQVDWDKFIQESNHTIDIVVYYWDKWVDEHAKALESFFSKQNTVLKLYLSDETQSNILEDIRRLFPDHSKEDLIVKIQNTQKKLRFLHAKTHNPSSKIEIYKVPFLLNYSAQCFDREKIHISLFEMSREDRVDSPAFFVDLNQSPNMMKFFQKEIEGLQTKGQRVLP